MGQPVSQLLEVCFVLWQYTFRAMINRICFSINILLSGAYKQVETDPLPNTSCREFGMQSNGCC